MLASKKSIIDYYNLCNNAYRDAWDLDKNMQLNLGLWKKGTRNLAHALQNLNQEIADVAIIKNDDKVLDAGCGVGGTAIYLAKHHSCRVIGISLVENQISKARQNAIDNEVSDLVDFKVMDYTQTNFKDNSFDLITGIESICYAEPKSSFLDEAYRILKPGGRLVMAENLQAKEVLNHEEFEMLYSNAFHGCQVKSLDSKENYIKNLGKSGFHSIECMDYTKLIRPSIKRLRRFYYPAWLYNKYHEMIGRKFNDVQLANTKMCYYLQTSLERGLWSYGIIKAVK